MSRNLINLHTMVNTPKTNHLDRSLLTGAMCTDRVKNVNFGKTRFCKSSRTAEGKTRLELAVHPIVSV